MIQKPYRQNIKILQNTSYVYIKTLNQQILFTIFQINLKNKFNQNIMKLPKDLDTSP